MCDGVLAASFCVGGEEKEGLCGMASGFEGCELQQQQQQQQQQVNNSALEGKFRDPKLSCANCSSLRCCDMEKELLEHRILELESKLLGKVQHGRTKREGSDQFRMTFWHQFCDTLGVRLTTWIGLTWSRNKAMPQTNTSSFHSPNVCSASQYSVFIIRGGFLRNPKFEGSGLGSHPGYFSGSA